MGDRQDVATSESATEPNSPAAEPGPSLLSERSLLGIFVHLIGFATGLVGPGLVYLVSENEFTRANARNALNWQLFLAPVFVGIIVFLVGGMGVSSLGTIPEALELALFVPLSLLLAVAFVLSLLTFVFPVVATAKAILGEAWEYPLAPEFV